VEDVRIQLIDKTVDEQALREREAQWAYRLKTISPLGLNSDDFFSKGILEGTCYNRVLIIFAIARLVAHFSSIVLGLPTHTSSYFGKIFVYFLFKCSFESRVL